MLLREEIQSFLQSKELLNFYKNELKDQMLRASLASSEVPSGIPEFLARERLLGVSTILNPLVDLFESANSQLTASIEQRKKQQTEKT